MTARYAFNFEAFALFVHMKRVHPTERSMSECADEAGVTKAQLFRAVHTQPINTEAFLSLCFWIKTDPLAFLLDGTTGQPVMRLPDMPESHETIPRPPYVMHGPMTPEYRSWRSMLNRCYNSAAPSFRHYGGRGIVVCDRWHFGEWGEDAYRLFLADMGPRPEEHSLDRIDVHGNYEPGNCRWATHTIQARNTRRNRFVEYAGRRITISEAVEMAGDVVSRQLAAARIGRGWSVEASVETPAGDPRPQTGEAKAA